MADDVYKKELSLSLNNFGQPQEYSGKLAWAHVIMNLILMEPGTYPSQPDMGVGLNRYQYRFLETWQSEVLASIKLQVKTYLPDIPVDEIQLLDYTSEKGNYIVFKITFTDDIPGDRVVTVASEQKDNEIHFAIGDIKF
jgi:hypothetical protein